MINIYRKCEKSIDNIYGIKKIESLDEIDRPFLFCISPKEDDNSTFGIIKEGARACRVRTTDELSGGFKIDEMGALFLGFREENDGVFVDLVNDFLYPLLTRIKDINSIKKNARKMNFFVYCNGINIYKQIERRLYDLLKQDGYLEEQIVEIISQISLVSIAPNSDINNIIAAKVAFKDVCDRDVYDYTSKVAEKRLNRDGRMSTIGGVNNGAIYAYYGTGEHELKSYLKDENMVKSSLCAITSKFLENSIQNETTFELIPISKEFIIPIILKNNGEFEDVVVLLSKLDSTLQYGNVSKYSKEESDRLLDFEKSLKSDIHRL